jgi:hypothetical protein
MDEQFPQTELMLAEMRLRKQANAISEMRERILFLKIKEKKMAKAITRKHEWAKRLQAQLLKEGVEPVKEKTYD